MDNITHTIAGLLLAEAAVQVRRSRPARATPPTMAFQTTAAVTSVIASNLPDGDLLYSTGKLGYLLHHRGHTHTLLVAALMAPLLWAVALGAWRLIRRHDVPPTAEDRRWLLALCFIGTLGHVGFDALNNYGVHPFWPLNDAWYYGDTLFILEPWLWVIAVPALVLATRRSGVRVALALALAGGLVAAWTVSFVPWGVALALTIATALCAAAAPRFHPGRRVAFAFAGWLVVALVFVGGTTAATAQVERALRAEGTTRVLDIALTPAVSNPLCHNALVVETEAPLYRVRSATVAAFPALLSPARCAPEPRGSSPAMWRSERPATSGVRWESEWSAPAAQLADLDRDNCVASAALRFIRVPFWYQVAADSLLIGDLRYDRGDGEGFAELRVPTRPSSCPRAVPPWRPPRHDLLESR